MGVNQDYCQLVGWKLNSNSIAKNNPLLSEDDLEEKIDKLLDLYGRWSHDNEDEETPNFVYLPDFYEDNFEIFGKKITFHLDSGNGTEDETPTVFPIKLSKKELKEILDLVKLAEKETGLKLLNLIKDVPPCHISLFYYS